MHVEDDPSIQAVAKVALEVVGGFTVETCSGGEEALKSFHAFAPQLILLDVMMPGMDGPSTLKKMQSDFDLSAIPVVFMTAKVQANEIESYKALGAADVVVLDGLKAGDTVITSGVLALKKDAPVKVTVTPKKK